MEIYFVRHGETDYNKTRRIQGRTDIPLNEDGRSQAKEAARKLAGMSFSYVYVSPLERARTTAEILTGQTSDHFITDQRLTELSFGVMEGTRIEELPEQMKALFSKPEAYVEPEGGESLSALIDRCGSFLRDLLEKLKKEKVEQPVLVVSHGAAIRGLLHCITNSPLSDFWVPGIGNCCVIRIQLDDGKLCWERR